MGKRKLFAICLTIALMASGCGESKSIGESSEMSNADVEIEVSEITENNEESKEEVQSVPIESKKISNKEEEPNETIEQELSNAISNAEEAIEEVSEVVAQVSEEQISEIPESEREHSTIPNEEAIIRYNPPTSTDMDGTEESEEEIQIWAITQCECMTCDGDIIEEGTYVRVLWNDLDDEYCVIQWYDAEANISEHGLAMFEIFESDTYDIIAHKKTAGIITP